MQNHLFYHLELRPTASAIRDALLSANIVCLKREVAISREQSVECTAFRSFTEDNRDKIEVWVGSGETEQSQISWFTLGVVKKQVKTKTKIVCFVRRRLGNFITRENLYGLKYAGKTKYLTL